MEKFISFCLKRIFEFITVLFGAVAKQYNPNRIGVLGKVINSVAAVTGFVYYNLVIVLYVLLTTQRYWKVKVQMKLDKVSKENRRLIQLGINYILDSSWGFLNGYRKSIKRPLVGYHEIVDVLHDPSFVKGCDYGEYIQSNYLTAFMVTMTKAAIENKR